MSACSVRPAWVKEALPNIWRFPGACACPRSRRSTHTKGPCSASCRIVQTPSRLGGARLMS
eukprot:4137158-Prymnesium_polylepis.1